MKAVSDSNVSLTRTGNNATTIAASVTAANKAFSYTDTDGVSVGQVSADSTQDGGAATLGTVTGLTTLGNTGGTVTVSAGGLLTVDQAINTKAGANSALVGGAVVLKSTGAVTLNAAALWTFRCRGDARGVGSSPSTSFIESTL